MLNATALQARAPNRKRSPLSTLAHTSTKDEVARRCHQHPHESTLGFHEVALAVFSVSAFAGSLLLLLSAATWFAPRIAFWPPPRTDSWQYVAFWSLFRILVLGVVICSFLDFGGIGRQSLWQLVIGGVLVVMGFSLAFWATYVLGWRDAHGEANSLKTTGWFGWSRNPIYVVSVVGMLGLSLLAHSVYVNMLLVLWATMHLLAPILEEPWLEQRFGAEFREYKRRVNRFVGWRGE